MPVDYYSWPRVQRADLVESCNAWQIEQLDEALHRRPGVSLYYDAESGVIALEWLTVCAADNLFIHRGHGTYQETRMGEAAAIIPLRLQRRSQLIAEGEFAHA